MAALERELPPDRLDSEIVSFEVAAEDARQRLDLYLAQRFPEKSRSRIQEWIRAERVTVGGGKEKAGYLVRPGDVIAVSPPPPEPLDLIPEAISIRIPYEDDFLIVVDKPAGLVVHPGAGNRRGTLVNALLYHFQNLSRHATVRPGIVHRLDKQTSGLLVVAKDERTHDRLAQQFKLREVKKEYLALVHGRMKSKEGRIEVAIGRDQWLRTRVSTRSRKLRPASTHYQVIRLFRQFSYLRVNIKTGRTHQIRVHLQHIGHPVVGDETYAGNTFRNVKDPVVRKQVEGLGRQFLHAAVLGFKHPEDGRQLEFESPLPPELAVLLSNLE
jgi:23S rRNA pseudouridine1911/1915/1917 synthase